jgi:hypothetical protein
MLGVSGTTNATSRYFEEVEFQIGASEVAYAMPGTAGTYGAILRTDGNGNFYYGRVCTTAGPYFACVAGSVDGFICHDPAVGCGSGSAPDAWQCQDGTWNVISETRKSSCARGSCFVGGTKVKLQNGEFKNIEEVSVGEIVLGADGEPNQVVGIEKPLMLPDDEQKLISINGGKPFTTNNHPILTSSGWKAYIPEHAQTEAFDELKGKVERLSVGDKIVNLDGSLTEVKSIQTVQREEPVKLYNLHVDGNKTFNANGIIVHSYVPDKQGFYGYVNEHSVPDDQIIPKPGAGRKEKVLQTIHKLSPER